ncbi:helix-turn-helix transcriptional regulator [Dysgonomonas capnocytophagoides]|uniref:Helix-turn-helix transcriptional regulator n=1 Tax=Dysgonomonas capnocytophagoides TaxID=45254 RepID=A0A4Y8L239_9BACT|nr:S24 family peptidase [Dysgonomonas capnocytophagoides]TFD96725.1 helix-turn-helix transcriptional regulator [Dysgonomonas capnocytophagoides]
MKKERLKDAYNYLRSKGIIHTQKDLSLKMGTDQGNISNALKGSEKYLTDKFLEKFNEAFDDIFNISWLLTGEGLMLKEEQNSISETDNTNILKDTMDNVTVIPLLPISAQGGTFNDFVLSIKKQDCEKIISPILDADFAIPVAGDSMLPEYPSGSKALVKKINREAFIEWGCVYVLDTCNGIIIKQIVPSEKEGYIKCVSLNPNPKFAPFDVATDNIFGMYRVMMCLSPK